MRSIESTDRPSQSTLSLLQLSGNKRDFKSWVALFLTVTDLGHKYLGGRRDQNLFA
ncbi:unnamed protein product [Camellia sinensis]